MKMNKDGSVNIYVGPKSPKGIESNRNLSMDKGHTDLFDYIEMLYNQNDCIATLPCITDEYENQYLAGS